MTPTTLPESALAALPESLRGEVALQWGRFSEAALAAGGRIPSHPDFLKALTRVWAVSQFVAESCQRDPALLGDLLDSGDLLGDYAPREHREKLAGQLAAATDEAALMRLLRRFRRREMVRIAWRDLAGWADLAETLNDLSQLAEACVCGALARLEAWQRREHGTPKDGAGRPIGLVVLGMGKLGAWELNFSSDIDLIYAYAEEGEIRGRNGLSHAEFFTHLGQRLFNALNANTGDGFVYRVDLRLRPYGDSGPTAMSFDAMEEYYVTQGREWERYAMIKARVVAGDRAAGERLMQTLRPFVYRRYLDYGVFESLREMKAMIEHEVARRGMQDNVKLGPGGIREVEFIGQAFQLVRGGRETELQERGILKVLALLAEGGALPAHSARELAEAYDFLRRSENRIQAWDDRQVHLLPADPAGQARLAFAMGFADWAGFKRALKRHRRHVQDHFAQVFSAPQAAAGGAAGAPDLVGVWQGTLADTAADSVLAEAGFGEPERARALLHELRHGSLRQSLSSVGRDRLDRLMPLLIAVVGHGAAPDSSLPRVVSLVESIARRSAYVALLMEHPLALSQLVRLYAASPWIATHLTQHPLLLDELLDPRTLYTPPGREALAAELAGLLARLPEDDLERQMDLLRQFKQANVLRVAAADIVEAIPLMAVSDHLTWIAEAVAAEVLELAWRHLVARHGRPPGRGGDGDKGFAVIAYGKLGGIELGYGSDLDLVFLHGAADEERSTDGPRPLVLAEFFARLAQRVVHLMNAHTAAGVLYEVDLRLRPSGASGLLVSGLEAFVAYQREEAWTWEHQALVRARPVAGDAAVAAQFQRIRRELLTRRRDPETLRREVREMRERMRAEFGSRRPGRFRLKHDRGGIADIEFMVQYGVLAWAHDHPELTEFTDNIRILEGFGRAGLMSAEEVKLLGDAYRSFRKRAHRLTLLEQSAEVDDTGLRDLREAVARIWRERMEGKQS